jgi:hypothetical protein
MANAWYRKAKVKFLRGQLNWEGITAKVLLLKSGYTPNFDLHEFLSDIPAAARVATSDALTNKAVVETEPGRASCDADDVQLIPPAGQTVVAFVIFHDTGTEATSPLIAYFDTMTGLPFTTSGGTVTIVWDNGPGRILTLL